MKRYLLFCYLTFFGFIIFNFACFTHASKINLYINYHYSAETIYTNIRVNNSILFYTYFDDVDNKSENWLKQYPVWTKNELVTKKVVLTEKECFDLIELIEKSNFLNLRNSYGGAKSYQRYYPHTISVKLNKNEKKVTCQSFPGAFPTPKAFNKLKNKLLQLVDSKIEYNQKSIKVK